MAQTWEQYQAERWESIRYQNWSDNYGDELEGVDDFEGWTPGVHPDSFELSAAAVTDPVKFLRFNTLMGIQTAPEMIALLQARFPELNIAAIAAEE